MNDKQPQKAVNDTLAATVLELRAENMQRDRGDGMIHAKLARLINKVAADYESNKPANIPYINEDEVPGHLAASAIMREFDVRTKEDAKQQLAVLDDLERDAKRYRWLMENAKPVIARVAWGSSDDACNFPVEMAESALDAAIESERKDG